MLASPSSSSSAWPRVAGAAARLWRSALEFSIVCMLSLQEVGHEVLLALWALRLRDARLTFPWSAASQASTTTTNSSSSNGNGNGSSSASDNTGSDYDYDHDSDANPSQRTSAASSRRHARRRSSALAFLEQFRHGPENQSEWNLFLWRVTFPMVPLVLFTVFAVVGKMGHALYSLVVCPVWFLCNFVLVVYPFDVVFRFPDIDAALERSLRYALVAVSVSISAIEWYVSSPTSRFSWVVGNTLFGVVALVGIPLFFATQNRIPRTEQSSARREDVNDDLQPSQSQSQYDALLYASGDDDRQHVALESAVLSPPLSLSEAPTGSAAEGASGDATGANMRLRAPPVPEPHSAAASGSQRAPLSNHTHHSSLASPNASAPTRVFTHATLDRPPPANRKSKLLMITAVSIIVVWLAMFSSYNASRSSTRHAGVASRYWFLTYVLSPALCVVLFWTRQQHTHFSLDHVVVYGVLIVHIPVFLGHFCLRLFAMAEDTGATASSSSSWIKLAISVLYLLVMQGYFFVITHVVNAMAEPFAHPSLLYVGQLYYYIFWYILVGSDTPIDALYWGMLLVNNVHIAFLNTGIYTDVKRSSLSCGAALGPLNMVSVGSSVAVCFRASAARLRLDDASSDRTARSLKHAAHTDDEEGDPDDDEPLDASESEGFLSDHDSVLPVYAKTRRPRSARKDAAARQSRHRQGDRSNEPPRTSVASCSAAAVTALRDTCTDDRSVKRSGSGRRRRGGGATYRSSTASAAEHLKPLYFLMKLAEQDNMADTTALILVPSLLTLMAVFEKPSEGLAIVYDQRNMWLRCICMFIGRLGGSYLAREIFAYKLKSRLRPTAVNSSSHASGTIEGLSTRLWIQRLMLQDFHRQFWYLTVVTIVVTFACFDRVDLPLRFALLT